MAANDLGVEIPYNLTLNKENFKALMEAPVIAFDIETLFDNFPEEHWLYHYIHDRNKSKGGLSLHHRIVCISLVWGMGTGTVKDLEAIQESVVLAAPFDQETLLRLRMIMGRKDCEFVAHNAVFDVLSLVKLLGMPIPENLTDTRASAYTLGMADKGDSGLMKQCVMYGVTADYEWLAVNKEARKDLRKLPKDRLLQYVVEDSRLTLQLREKHMYWVDRLVRDTGYVKLPFFLWLDQAYMRAMVRQAVMGMRINVPYIWEQIDQITELRKPFEEHFQRLGVGNLVKPGEVKRYVHFICGVPVPELEPVESAKDGGVYYKDGQWWKPKTGESQLWTDTGNPSYNGDALDYYGEKYPQLKLMDYYRHMMYHLGSLYTLLAHAEAVDGKEYVHPLIGIGTVTGRTAAQCPNNLNPSMDAPAKADKVVLEFLAANGMELDTLYKFSMRGVYSGDEGCHLAELDYSNAETRMAAIATGSRKLAHALCSRDMHSIFASIYYRYHIWNKTLDELSPLLGQDAYKMEWDDLQEACYAFGDDSEQVRLFKVLKDWRGQGKGLTFGRFYGLGKRGVHSRLHFMTLQEVDRMLQDLTAEFPVLENGKNEIQLFAQDSFYKMRNYECKALAHGYVETWSGRRILLPDPYYDKDTGNKRDKWYKGFNYVMQGGVADLVKIDVVQADAYLANRGENQLGTNRVLVPVHDSLIMNLRVEDGLEVLPDILLNMETVLPFESTVVDDVWVDWPAGLDNKENKGKWGYTPNGEYPWDDQPLKISADPEAVLQRMIDNQEHLWAEQDKNMDRWLDEAEAALQPFPIWDSNFIITEWCQPEDYLQAVHVAKEIGPAYYNFTPDMQPYVTDFLDSVTRVTRIENTNWEARHKREVFREQFFALDN